MIQRASSKPAVGIEPTTAPSKDVSVTGSQAVNARSSVPIRIVERRAKGRCGVRSCNGSAILPLALGGGNVRVA